MVRPKAVWERGSWKEVTSNFNVWEGHGEFTGQRASLTEKCGSQHKDSGKFWWLSQVGSCHQAIRLCLK